MLYAFDTWKYREKGFDEEAVRKAYPLVSKYLGVDRPDAEKLSFERYRKPVLRFDRRPNIVIIFMESFAAFKVGCMGNKMNGTPHFDAIARQSQLYRNFYCPEGPTARAIFSVITGIPDVTSTGSSSRNPLVVNQHTIASEFKGYDKMYLCGGSASWGNIRGLLKYNIPGITVYEEGSYDSPRMDVWGISDYHLFQEAHQVFRRQDDKPFLAFIQTAGNPA